MNTMLSKFKTVALVTVMAVTVASCKKDDDAIPNLRASVDYTKLTATTDYSKTFVDASNATTVDFTNGGNRYKIFQAINAYAGTATTTVIDANVLKNMLSNTGSPFTGTYAALNGTSVQLRNIIASSKPTAEADAVRAKIDADFATMALISQSNAVTAEKGKAGKLGTRIVDAKGMETAQIIQKSLIGALQLDYISNVLLTKGLEADNHKVLAGKNYTQLEQNWDEAYALLTPSAFYLAGSTDLVRGTTEFALGSYVWEYNKANYAKIYPAFLKGRAAIVNNDMTELKAQATFIKTQFEFAIASAAVGYLEKWGTRTTDADRAHDIGEGGGFLYSLRFCTINGADAAFSDGIITNLISTTGGFWDITPAKIATASAAIKAKFKL
jgi:hypothetical protein